MVVLIYLLAIVLANWTVAMWGPAVSVVNAFLFIGLDLTCRDRLHDGWAGRWLWPKMLGLIAVGGLLSWLVNRDAGAIALASLVAFVLAGIADAVAYAGLASRPRAQRVNGSNVAGALVDSVAFPLLAFGGVLPWVMLGQFVAKVLGGFVWLLVWERVVNGKIED